MIVYLDTSAFVPLLVEEPGSALCRRLWDEADAVVSCRLLFVETAAALAQAHRLGRLTAENHRTSLRLLEDLWPQFDVVELGDGLVRQAAVLAGRFGLRGYDAVHCAAAEILADADTVAASGDRLLLDAWAGLGVSAIDTHDG